MEPKDWRNRMAAVEAAKQTGAYHKKLVRLQDDVTAMLKREMGCG